MAISISIFAVFLVFVSQCQSSPTVISDTASNQTNYRPIIGILTQELSYRMRTKYPSSYKSYIAASYVKFIEGAGARVVPIWIGQDDDYYTDILSKINGVVWPGGATLFNNTAGYADAGEKIYRIAKRFNKANDYFPILGICLGFELLTYLAAGGVDPRINCDSHNQRCPLDFKPDFRNSKMFKDAPEDVIRALQHERVTANFHGYCITESGLPRGFRVLSTNHDLNEVKFVSSIEHVSKPFYGLQFHPEKNIYEWITGKEIPHGPHSTLVAQYFANFFVGEARKNRHRFSSKDQETARLIYNYQPTYTALKGSAYQQCYMFKESDYYN